MKTRELPILEYPGDGPGVIEPIKVRRRRRGFPDRFVLCFFLDAVTRFAEELGLEPISKLPGEGYPTQVYELADPPTGFCFPGIGAPFSAAVLEEIIALGAQKIICCGGAGALTPDLEAGAIVVPTEAVRDEGTSYHYQRRGRCSRPHPAALQAIHETLEEAGVGYRDGRTWTTDAVYRETPQKVAARREEGCLCVEMEAAALFAVARFRGIALGQILYGGDDVSGEQWDHRNWINLHSVRERLLQLAIDACRKIP